MRRLTTSIPCLAFIVSMSAPATMAEEPRPLPEANAFVKGLADVQRRHEEALNDYTYDVVETEEQLDKSGTVKETKTSAYEVFFVKGRMVQRQVAEDGVAFDAARLAKEDRKVDERIRDIHKDASKREPDSGPRMSEVLDRYDFRTIGREEIDGRPAIAMEFVPRPGKRKLEGDGIMRNLAGRLWVDEEERELVRAEIRNTGGIKIGLGVVASISKVDATLQFRKVADGVWLPSRVESTAVGRVLLLKGIRQRNVRTYSRYRRFEVDAQEAEAEAKTPVAVD